MGARRLPEEVAGEEVQQIVRIAQIDLEGEEGRGETEERGL
jgi:hypothetical protein